MESRGKAIPSQQKVKLQPTPLREFRCDSENKGVVAAYTYIGEPVQSPEALTYVVHWTHRLTIQLYISFRKSSSKQINCVYLFEVLFSFSILKFKT